jgi:putative colanic acid biosynthesis UDP-glucose lipid carrier transferase
LPGRRDKTITLPNIDSLSLITDLQALALPLCTALAALIAKYVFINVDVTSAEPVSFYIGVGMLAAIVMMVISSQSEINSKSAMIAGLSKAPTIVATVSVSFLFLFCLFYLLHISDHFPTIWFTVWYVTTIVVLLVARSGFLFWARLLCVKEAFLQRVAIYGRADLAQQVLTRLLQDEPNLGFAGLFSDDTQPAREVTVVGGLRELIVAAQKGACNRIIVALPGKAVHNIQGTLASLECLPIQVQLSPDAMIIPCKVHGSNRRGALLLLDVQRKPLSERGLIIKSAMDYLIGLLALLIFAPAMLAIAIAIKVDSPGPVLFIQSRHGYNHRVIRVMKFRTMTVAEDGPMVKQAVRGDTRVTRVGRFLRRTSLDELPQLLNVLRGELSLVGPRPHALSHNEGYSKILSSYSNRHKVKPGITGWAQVKGFRGEITTHEALQQRLKRDLYYIDNWSPWLDLQILARTAFVPFFSRNAY